MIIEYQRHSPLHGVHVANGAEWAAHHGMTIPASFKTGRAADECLANVALADVSALPKLGVKGPGAVAWLTGQGVSVPDTVYACRPMDDGGTVIRVDTAECFLEDRLGNNAVDTISAALDSDQAGVYRVPRQDAGLLLCGPKAVDVLTQTCGLDFRRLGTRLVYTRVAVVSVALLMLPDNNAPSYRIWCQPSSAEYLWETLAEIANDIGGGTVGLDAVARLL